MAYTLESQTQIRSNLKQIARNELRRASTRLSREQSSEAVHEARKSVKKVEAVVKLFDQIGAAPPKKDIGRLREARRILSTVRDGAAMVETFDQLQSRFKDRIAKQTSAVVRARLVRAQSKITDRAQRNGSLASAQRKLRKTRRAISDWSSPSIAFFDLPAVFRDSLRASREAMTCARSRRAAPDFHRWRKRVKKLWYQLRLGKKLVPRVSTQIDELKTLETDLGMEHNLVVLKATLSDDAELRPVQSEVKSLIALAATLQTELRRNALDRGQQVHSALRKVLGSRRVAQSRSRGKRRPVAPRPKAA